MSTQYARPKWWQLYLTFPLLIILFVADHRLKISLRGHEAVQIGIIILIFGLMQLWLKANATALSHMDRMRYHGTVTEIQIPANEFSNYNLPPLFHLPESEIKGMLSDTFERDSIDLEFTSCEEDRHELKVIKK